MKKAVSLVILVLFVSAVGIAWTSAPKSGATSTICHSTKLSIKSASTVKTGRKLKVTGQVARSLGDHYLMATLQWRKASVATWKNGATVTMSTKYYTLSWKAPAKKGKYKIRVRAQYSGENLMTATRTVTVY